MDRVVRRRHHPRVEMLPFGGRFVASQQFGYLPKLDLPGFVIFGWGEVVVMQVTNGKVGMELDQWDDPDFTGDADDINLGHLGSSATKHWCCIMYSVLEFVSGGVGYTDAYLRLLVFSVDRRTGKIGDQGSYQIIYSHPIELPDGGFRLARFQPWAVEVGGVVSVFSVWHTDYYDGSQPWPMHLRMSRFTFDVDTGQMGAVSETAVQFDSSNPFDYIDENYPIITEHPARMPDGKIAVPITTGVFSYRDLTFPGDDARAGCHVVIADPSTGSMDVTTVYAEDPSYWGAMTVVPTHDGLLVNVALTGYHSGPPFGALPNGEVFDSHGTWRLYHYGYDGTTLTFREYVGYKGPDYWWPGGGQSAINAEWFIGGVSGGAAHQTTLFGGPVAGELVTVWHLDGGRNRWGIRTWSVASGSLEVGPPQYEDLHPTFITGGDVEEYSPYYKMMSRETTVGNGYHLHLTDDFPDDWWVAFRPRQ